ncbi:hypothetical protein RhiLY_10077 [Ceratobasidium sp. AG-Ba]|nr:hypothetical protein RhiLY_10077 [Ceratobasidium sp. AG-Ba]
MVPASNRKIAETKFQGKGNAAGNSSDQNQFEHEDQGNEVAGENEKTEDGNGEVGGGIDGSGDGEDDQDMAGVEDRVEILF